MLDTGLDFFKNLNASFFNIFHSEKGDEAWSQVMTNWQLSSQYNIVEKYVALGVGAWAVYYIVKKL